MARMAKINRYVSGDGESLNADMIHRALGETRSSARIAAPNPQFRTTRTRSATCARGSAAEDGARRVISNINNRFIDNRQHPRLTIAAGLQRHQPADLAAIAVRRQAEP